MSDVVLAVRSLQKTFRLGFFRKRIDAVRGVDFEVREGEIFGLLGPNGAGKTTTIKMVLRLIFPTAGTIELFGDTRHRPSLMQRIGYVPENPYVYQYLKPLEFLDLCGRLTGLDAPTRKKRATLMIERVGLSGAVDRPIGKLSKGMTQRIGLAQAMLHDPELLILDEPMSGLDPIGRREVRELIAEEHRAGKTILFTSHILTDVEQLCDRVGILQRGEVRHYGRLSELLGRSQTCEVVLADVSEALEEQLGPDVHRTKGDDVAVRVPSDELSELLANAIAAGARVMSVTPTRETLEDLFLRDSQR
ncbi:MAG: ATP-binding cassette domain-containing protein [Sandaracinaceae bacterium]